eukprot:CAMPEP_0117029348 /NCGR_PEP_ID=MMETSP0472-20121206/21257_1 /TAXON_ID=693140 ORGANISM="Tiarina fusus, Strain LIS" /NCGR_SAMPLE_ID=MMETSP0472 /ASSEMBLY_ACC=CAM_ASM_000603 /LENGTH=322 /DNA_ID=CAMNT_0004737085 /DNA_START=47 /DNA_END=1016 /DNA_ORIENTATION=+
MNSTIETSTSSLFSAPAIFLTDFQDKNAHLFPSNALSFEGTEVSTENTSCGSKRKRECLYDSFSGWTEDLLSDDSFVPLIDSDVISSGIIDLCDTKIKSENAHVSKKQKLEDEEDLPIFISDARSRSPPFQPIDFDIESVENVLSPSDNINIPPPAQSAPPPPTNDVLSVTQKIISQTNSSIRASMFESLSRLANNMEQGVSPVSFSKAATPLEKISSSQDYLAMQTIFGMTVRPQPVVKPEYCYTPVTAAGIPFVMNNPYMLPKYTDASTLAYKQSLASNMYSACPKNMVYSTPRAYVPSYSHANLVPTQNIFPSSNIHVL